MQGMADLVDRPRLVSEQIARLINRLFLKEEGNIARRLHKIFRCRMRLPFAEKTTRWAATSKPSISARARSRRRRISSSLTKFSRIRKPSRAQAAAMTSSSCPCQVKRSACDVLMQETVARSAVTLNPGLGGAVLDIEEMAEGKGFEPPKGFPPLTI